MRVAFVACCTAVALFFPLASVAAAPPELPVGFVFADGKLGPLKVGVAYEASRLPIPFRVTPPTFKWGGSQWKANGFTPTEIALRHLKCPAACKPPFFGWAVIGQHGGPSTHGVPRGLVIVMTGYSRTPSVAATVTSLRTRGHGATYQPTSTVKVGGFPAIQFDGIVTGSSHVFIPFSPPTHTAQGFPDSIEVHGAGHNFRFDVVNVRGKTVVILTGTEALTTNQFGGFLDEATQLIASFRFPP
jgi:hypothetical protein